MKIAILSMQRIDNFGSLLQAYSLKKILENENNSVEFIDIQKNEDDNKISDNKYIPEKTSIVLKIINRLNKDFFRLLRLKLRINQQLFQFEKFRKDFLNIKLENNSKKYDVCVIGSDEVFNCSAKSKWGFTSQLFGNINNANRIITYAACCGMTTINSISLDVKNKIIESFKNISNFSVRDENTYDFVQSLTDDKDIKYNLDPVLIGDFTEEINRYGKITNLPKKYCIIYSYFNRINNKSDIKLIKDFCKNNGLEIITVGAPQLWNKNFYVMNPFEMLYAFSKADFIITDTFHGTIFSAKYAKKFAVLIQDSNKFKLSDLIYRLKIENHRINNFKELYDVYKCDKNTKQISKILETEREKTIKYFNDCIFAYEKKK